MRAAASHKTRGVIGKVLAHLLLAATAVYTLVPFATILLTSFRTTADAVRGPFTWPREWDVISNYVKAWSMGSPSSFMI